MLKSYKGLKITKKTIFDNVEGYSASGEPGHEIFIVKTKNKKQDLYAIKLYIDNYLKDRVRRWAYEKTLKKLINLQEKGEN